MYKIESILFFESFFVWRHFFLAIFIQDIHIELEEKIAKFHNREACILFPSCFDANAGLFETLLTKEDAVISDELNHASIIDGIRLCKAQRLRFRHIDMEGELKTILKLINRCIGIHILEYV